LTAGAQALRHDVHAHAVLTAPERFEPAAHRLDQAEPTTADPDRGEVEVALHVVALPALDLDDRLSVDVTESVEGRPGHLRDIGHRKRRADHSEHQQQHGTGGQGGDPAGHDGRAYVASLGGGVRPGHNGAGSGRGHPHDHPSTVDS